MDAKVGDKNLLLMQFSLLSSCKSPQDKQASLTQAATSGDDTSVRRLLSDGGNANIGIWTGERPCEPSS